MGGHVGSRLYLCLRIYEVHWSVASDFGLAEFGPNSGCCEFGRIRARDSAEPAEIAPLAARDDVVDGRSRWSDARDA